MNPDDSPVTRRRFIQGGLYLGSGLLMGSTLSGCERRVTQSQPEEPSEDTGYRVTLSPVGTVTFSSVPKRVVAHDVNYADMMVALGVNDRLVALGWPERFQNAYVNKLYQQLPGLNADARNLTPLSEGRILDKELLYALDGDVHHIDPVQLQSFSGWSPDDVDEIRSKVGPFFGNRYSRAHRYSGAQPYEYYGIWELHEKMAAVYRRPEKARALRAIGKQLEKTVTNHRPDHRPKALLINYQDGTFWIRPDLNGPGISRQHLRKLGLRDALSAHSGTSPVDQEGKTDLEGIVALDPDILLEQWSIDRTNARMDELKTLRNDPLAKNISAVSNGRLYPGGSPLQGPLTYLFQLEMVAKQVYPEVFGPWRGHGQHTEDECLFDRKKVAEIILRDG